MTECSINEVGYTVTRTQLRDVLNRFGSSNDGVNEVLELSSHNYRNLPIIVDIGNFTETVSTNTLVFPE